MFNPGGNSHQIRPLANKQGWRSAVIDHGIMLFLPPLYKCENDDVDNNDDSDEDVEP